MSEIKGEGDGQYHFVLYIDSQKPKSIYVAARLREICREHLIDSYTLEVFDIRKDQLLFEQRRILAVPTLDVTTPLAQEHRFVGDLSQSMMFVIAVGMIQEASKIRKENNKIEKDLANECTVKTFNVFNKKNKLKKQSRNDE
jgi:hypothetical protein